jgi:Na+:H+ antiporter, NhaA family
LDQTGTLSGSGSSADDIGAIVVIAVFYTGAVSWGWLAGAASAVPMIFVMRRGDVQSLAPYLAVGAFAWLALLESGVHATLIGVALGLLTPAWPLRSPRRFPAEARTINRIEAAYYDRVLTPREFAESEQNIAEVSRLAMFGTSPLERLERAVSPWVAYVVVPVFALANAGVALDAGAVRGVVSDPTTIGVALGLVAGKTIGVFGATALTRAPRDSSPSAGHHLAPPVRAGHLGRCRIHRASLRDEAVVRHVATADAAKVGILAGSTLAGQSDSRSCGPHPPPASRSARRRSSRTAAFWRPPNPIGRPAGPGPPPGHSGNGAAVTGEPYAPNVR